MMIDLHMHTKHSDGEFSSIEMLKKCEEIGLDVISITDHDGCKAYYDFDNINVSDYYTGKIIKGVELTTIFEGRVIEILGYNIDHKVLQEFLSSYYTDEAKKERIDYCRNSAIDRLAKMGIVIDTSELEDGVSFDVAIYNEIMNEDNKDILGEDILKSVKNFYRLGITNPNSPLFVDMSRFRPDPKFITDLIHRGGGIAFLAHPCQYAFDDKLKMIDDIRKVCDLDGIECYHSTFSKDEMDMLVKYANDNNLLISGGSDYHGRVKPDIFLGTGTNNNLCLEKEKISWLD